MCQIDQYTYKAVLLNNTLDNYFTEIIQPRPLTDFNFKAWLQYNGNRKNKTENNSAYVAFTMDRTILLHLTKRHRYITGAAKSNNSWETSTIY